MTQRRRTGPGRRDVLTGAAALACAAAVPGSAIAARARPDAPANPLLADWSGPFGGVPPFDKVRVADFKPALEAAMVENRREIDAIANDPSPPNFENTLAMLERTGRTLDRVQAIFGVWSSSLSSTDLQRVATQMEPKLAAFNDAISHNPQLFARVAAVHGSTERAKLSPEQQRLVEVYYDSFVRQGMLLSPADKAEYDDADQRLAMLYNQFGQNQAADAGGHPLVLVSPADLAGLPPAAIDAAAQGGQWVIYNSRDAMEAFLAHAERRDLREKAWRLWTGVGERGDAHDNNRIAAEILVLRAKRSRLLGFKSFADWQLADTMAATPDRAMALMLSVWTPAVSRARKDIAEMQAVVDSEHGGFKIAPWDCRYYAEKLRKARCDIDAARAWLRYDQVRDAMFWSAGRLYGLSFTRLPDAPVYHPDVEAYAVSDGGGKRVGVLHLDAFARPGKSGGAWEQPIQSQAALLDHQAAIVVINANLAPGARDMPWSDARTLFFLLGQALMDLCSDVTYPTLAGAAAVARDAVSFPAQFNENYLSTPEVMAKFLRNARGEPMPADLVARVERARRFNQGFDVVEFLASAIVDLRLHMERDGVADPKAFAAATLAKLGLPPEIAPRHPICQFDHMFAGETEAALYYNDLWAEVLDHDAFAAFIEAGGPYHSATAKRLHDDILSVGNTVDPNDAYHAFRGRDARVGAYLDAHGFAVTA